ncbi:hypothetical protein D3C76_979160 [compost metagenome]
MHQQHDLSILRAALVIVDVQIVDLLGLLGEAGAGALDQLRAGEEGGGGEIQDAGGSGEQQDQAEQGFLHEVSLS